MLNIHKKVQELNVKFLKLVKNKDLSPRLKKMKRTLLFKSPFKKAPIKKSA